MSRERLIYRVKAFPYYASKTGILCSSNSRFTPQNAKIMFDSQNNSTLVPEYEGSPPPKSCFKFLLCTTSVVYKFFAENIRTEIEQAE